ncbi:hypothetical protein HHK36_007502 [Tetracentron sinense]|uniref:Uncharacterized protein n=1 Tax=Tetracentron sinense TaxID=13715 RepID=A0A834ZNJ2_TETSI|nr:hypothetical protein HHK36_007502 [Tetracentron sinense]
MLEKEAEELRSIRKSDIVDWYNTYLRPPSPRCWRLALRVWGCNTDMKGDETRSKYVKVIEDLATLQIVSSGEDLPKRGKEEMELKILKWGYEKIKIAYFIETVAATSMAATISTMAMPKAKCLSINSPKNVNPSKPTIKPISLLSLQNLPKGLTTSSLTGSAIAGAIFSTLSSCDSALAAQQIADIAEGDNRGLALLLPIIPAIAWVLYNILQPALNQINRMQNKKGVIVGLGLGGLTASSFVSTPYASASEMAVIADASSSNDNRGLLLLFVVAPAILWVLYNILQPALNQLNRMRSE